jgi:predicted dehydrogenase
MPDTSGRFRIGVIGLGFGLQHVRTLVNLPDARLVAVADRKPQNDVFAVAARYGVTAYEDGVEMLERETLDAVSICVGPHTREPLFAVAARKGVALFVEKPWAANVAQAQQLAELCARNPAPTMTAFSFRFHPVVARLRELLDGELGAGWLLSGEYVFGWLPAADGWLWKPEGGGGFFNENSCHLLDVVCHLLGEPVAVMAEASTPQETPSENAASVVIRFADGATASLTLGGVGAGGGAFRDYPRLRIFTAGGEAELRGQDHIWTTLRWTRRGEGELRELLRDPEALGDTRYSAAFRHFFACLRRGEKPAATIEDGVRCVRLAMAIYESARTGQRIKLTEDGNQEEK